MLNIFRSYIQSIIQLPDSEFQEIERITSKKLIQKKEHFVQIHERCSKVLFISQGYFRFYHFDAKGNEITSDFYFAPTFITSYTSFITGTPSYVNVQAMEDMEALEIQKQDLLHLYNKYAGIERLGRLIAEMVAINSEKHLFMLLNQSAEARYKNLLEKNPQYVNAIPLQYIASYLGITKETLSRIRKSSL